MTAGRLHPRLLPSDAERRYQELADLSLEALRETSAIEDAGAVYAATGASRVRAVELQTTQTQLRELAESHGYPESPGRAAAGAFDRGVADVLLTSGLLFPAEAAAPEVWSFYALVVAPDVAFWRWRDNNGTNPERLVGSDLTRHAFARMWWRGYLLCLTHEGDLNLDGLRMLDAFGEADWDQIQARRRAYGASPFVLQAIAAVWEQRRADIGAHAASDREVLRDFLKRLLRLGAFIRFDLLARETLNDELERAFDESLAAMGVETDATDTAVAAS